MTFKELFATFLAGTPIKRKAWRGYWRYCPRMNDIEIHNKDGTSLWLGESRNIIFTISGMLQNDWEYATDENCDIPVETGGRIYATTAEELSEQSGKQSSEDG